MSGFARHNELSNIQTIMSIVARYSFGWFKVFGCSSNDYLDTREDLLSCQIDFGQRRLGLNDFFWQTKLNWKTHHIKALALLPQSKLRRDD